MSKVHINDIDGTIVKSDSRYVVEDNTLLNNLVLSSTQLEPKKSTNGHSHPGQEEVYYITHGSGNMQLDDDIISVNEGDIVLIEDGVFHKVESGQNGICFICVFDGNRKHD